MKKDQDPKVSRRLLFNLTALALVLVIGGVVYWRNGAGAANVPTNPVSFVMTYCTQGDVIANGTCKIPTPAPTPKGAKGTPAPLVRAHLTTAQRVDTLSGNTQTITYTITNDGKVKTATNVVTKATIASGYNYTKGTATGFPTQNGNVLTWTTSIAPGGVVVYKVPFSPVSTPTPAPKVTATPKATPTPAAVGTSTVSNCLVFVDTNFTTSTVIDTKSVPSTYIYTISGTGIDGSMYLTTDTLAVTSNFVPVTGCTFNTDGSRSVALSFDGQTLVNGTPDKLVHVNMNITASKQGDDKGRVGYTVTQLNTGTVLSTTGNNADGTLTTVQRLSANPVTISKK